MSRFSEQSDLYAQFRPDYPKEIYDFIFDHLSSNESAWDCATGSGQIATYLADYFQEVIATDISSEQLSHAPERANIRYKEASAEKSGLPANHFDLITVGQAIHWFDIEAFYNEVRRVGKSEALLAVIGYGMVRVNEKVNPLIDDLYERAFSAYFNENRKYLDQHYRTLPFPFDEIEAPEFYHTINWSLADLEGYFNSWSAVQKVKSEQGYNPAAITVQELEQMLENHENIQVTFPVFMRLGRI